ncbi:hypothetical protein G9A89_008841 [Geosiphon pyriformis]|nr:hypothetical protein G9A89_008841 [Geosiphon pyriformis]
MGNYSYLPQQSEEHFEAHNKNNLDFIELNPLLFCLICFPIEKQSSRQFQNFWNWFLNEHSAETYIVYTTYYFDQTYFEDNCKERNNSINQLLYSTIFEQQPPDFEYLNHQIHIWIAAHQLTKTPLKTEEESYQTTPVFDLFSSESEHSTQTVTPEPMAQNPLQQNILITFQGIQTALGQKNNTLLPLFKGDAQDPIEWLNDFEKAATANQYDNEYKFQIIGGYLQNSLATWFSQETNFEIKFRTSILISKWHMELEKRTQGPGLRTDLSYAFWPLLALKNNSTMDMTIELAQKIENNQRMHLGSTLSVFASASALQMTVTFFAAQTQDPNEQLIDRLTANFAQLLELLAQAVRNNQQPQRPKFKLRFNQAQQPPY